MQVGGKGGLHVYDHINIPDLFINVCLILNKGMHKLHFKQGFVFLFPPEKDCGLEFLYQPIVESNFMNFLGRIHRKPIA